jgi:hypothetical protein
MSMPRFAIHRPVMMFMISAVIVLLGAISLLRLPVDLMPEVSHPSLTIRVSYPGVGPQRGRGELLTRPIEEAVAGGRRASRRSPRTPRARANRWFASAFTWGIDLDDAADDVRSRRRPRARTACPRGATRRWSSSSTLSASPSLSSASIRTSSTRRTLRQFTEDRIERRLERVPGVAAVDIRGGLRRQIRVDLDRDRLLALGVSAGEVSRLLRDREPQPPGRQGRGGQPRPLPAHRRRVQDPRPGRRHGRRGARGPAGLPARRRRDLRGRRGGDLAGAHQRRAGHPGGDQQAVRRQHGRGGARRPPGDRTHPARPLRGAAVRDHRLLGVHPAGDRQRPQRHHRRRPAGHRRAALLPAQRALDAGHRHRRSRCRSSGPSRCSTSAATR